MSSLRLGEKLKKKKNVPKAYRREERKWLQKKNIK